MQKTKKILPLLVLIVFLVFLKSDFRIINELRCCQDDYDYYSHALTLVQDFDFDYENQITSKARFYNQDLDKVAPMGFFGSGFLAAPFLLVGVLLDQLLNVDQEIMNYKKLFYSFSSIFYLLFSIILLIKTLKTNTKKIPIKLVFLGSGLLYFATERFSMTHVYEAFTISLILYISDEYYEMDEKSIKFSILLPIAVLLGFLVRWTNYYIVFIPLIVSLFKKDNGKKLIKDIYFWISSALSLLIFMLHTIAIYGFITFSPIGVYGAESERESLVLNIMKNPFNMILDFIQDTLIVLFTYEFGLIWFTPIVFIGFVSSLFIFLFQKKSNKFHYLLILACYGQCFFVISLWDSTASSFGFRYIFSLIPFSIYIIHKLEFNSFTKYIIKYLIIFSYFSLFAVLFFESSLGTQLSLSPVLNSFGVEKIYSQPDYLVGLLNSVFIFESYLKVFATSFLGAIVIKVSLFLFGYQNLVEILDKFGYASNTDLLDLITKVNIIESHIFIISLLLSVVATKIFLYRPNVERISL
jgi:hypothetical protein